jgi:hypothetical protein
MPDDLEGLVRQSLKTVDRSRRIAAAAIGLLFLSIVFMLGMVIAHARVADSTASKVLWVVAAAQMAFVGLCAALVAGHVTRMTKAVLRAIELSSRKP